MVSFDPTKPVEDWTDADALAEHAYIDWREDLEAGVYGDDVLPYASNEETVDDDMDEFGYAATIDERAAVFAEYEEWVQR